jgi:hypothetical protein
LAQDLPLGTWVKFTNSHGGALRAKLSWKSSIDPIYIFVNRKGAKVVEKSVGALASELRVGAAIILDSHPLLDRALDATMETLVRRAEA